MSATDPRAFLDACHADPRAQAAVSALDSFECECIWCEVQEGGVSAYCAALFVRSLLPPAVALEIAERV